MFFTQEDYRKIEKWLLANSKKDTQFVEAVTPLQGNETITFVQNGKNVKTSVKGIVEQFFLLGISDFLNISDKYNEKYITINQAIQLIPYRSRKIGQVITFMNTQGNWSIYQFRGESLNQWNNDTLWVDVIGSSSISDLVPDEEDITGIISDTKTILKFADKDFYPNSYSGLGRVYLRKNVVTIEDPITFGNKVINLLYQGMVSREDTIYILQYDYDLNNQTITIPNNSILLFEGGSISNGIINGQGASISSIDNKVIFGDNTIITGEWNVPYIYDTWFKFDDTPNKVNNQLITNILALSNDNINNTIHFDADRTYYFELPYKGKANLGDDVRPNYWKLNTEEYDFLRIFTGITSNTHIIFNNTLQMLPTNQGAYFIFHIEDKENIQISGKGTINADALNHKYDSPFAGQNYYGEWGHIFNIRSCNNIIINDITLGYAFGDAIGLGNKIINNGGVKDAGIATKNVTINGIKVLYARRNGISLGGNNYSITDVYFEGCGSEAIRGTAPKAAIDFENDHIDVESSGICQNVTMSNCKFKDNAYDVSSYINKDTAVPPFPEGTLVTISNCSFTAPLRLNKTTGLTFNDCHIVGITNHDNSIASWFASSNLIFNNCVFDELNPYLPISAEEQNKKFINPTYPEDIKYTTTFQHSLAVGKGLKFTIPKPLFGELEFTIFATNANNSPNQLVINKTTYTLGNSQVFTGIRDIKLSDLQNSTPRYASYWRTPVFSYVNYTEDANNYIIYLVMGSDLIGGALTGNTSVNIFLTSKTKFATITPPVSGNPDYAGMYGGKWSQLSAIVKESIDVANIPSSVTFPSKEMYPASLLADMPTSLSSDKVGKDIFLLDTDYRRPAFWDSYGNVFRTADGNRLLERRVTSQVELDTLTAKLTSSDRGYVVYITTFDSYLTWDGIQWINEDGSLFSKVKFMKRTLPIDTLNILFSYSNVTYKIFKDIDLGGGTLTIASNATLDFQGGSFTNGTIQGNNTSITGQLSYSIFNDCIISGFDIEYFDIRWFGAKDGQDCADAFDRCIACYNLAITTPIKIIGSYKLNRQINCVQGLVIWNDTNSGYAPNPIHIPTGGQLRYVGEIDVAKGITAFKVNHAGVSPLQYAKEATVSFRGIKFTCSESVGDGNYTSILLEYRAGGRPSRAFKFMDSNFSGFDKVFYFTGGDSQAGSMSSGMLLDNVNFKQNNYAIYTNTENPNINDMSFTGLQIVRCTFHTGSKLHLQGLYGSNSITLSLFESLNNPIYASFRVGHLKIDKVYFENNTGDYIFEGVQSGRDFVSILELGELYNINNSNSNPGWNITVKNMTLTHYPSLLQTATLKLDNCALNEQVLYGSNYPRISTNNIVLHDGTINTSNKVGAVCIKTENYNIVKLYDTDNYSNSGMVRGIFDVTTIDSFLDKKNLIPIQSINNAPTIQMPYLSPSGLNLAANTEYIFSFYKGNGYFIAELYNNNDVLIEELPLTYNDGIVILKVVLSNSYSGGYIKFRYVAAMTTTRFISPILIASDTPNKNLSEYIRLIASKRTYRAVGTTTQRPTPESTNIGYQYYDTTLNKPIWWNGVAWISSDGTVLT